jgi:hypothetical protein
MRAAVVGLLVAIGLASQAMAFQEDGFHSGMSEADALKVLSNYGSYKQESSPNVKGYYYMMTQPSAPMKVISICNGVLATYQTNIPGGWHAFMRTLERESRERGAGQYSMSSSETQYGPSNGLYFEWSAKADKLTLGYSQVGDTSNSILRMWQAPNQCGQ